MLGNLGFGELMVLLVIVLVLFGAKRIPEISGSFGKGIREFKRNLNDVESSIADTGAAQRVGRQSWRSEVGVHRTGADGDTGAEPKRLL